MVFSDPVRVWLSTINGKIAEFLALIVYSAHELKVPPRCFRRELLPARRACQTVQRHLDDVGVLDHGRVIF